MSLNTRVSYKSFLSQYPNSLCLDLPSAFRLFYIFVRSSTASLSGTSAAKVALRSVAYSCDIRDYVDTFFPYIGHVTKGFLSFIAHKCQISRVTLHIVYHLIEGMLLTFSLPYMTEISVVIRQ